MARMREVQKEHPEYISALNAKERANFVHGQVRQLVGVAVECIDGARVTDWDIDTVAVGGDLLVRFKYLGNGDPANNKSTEQQRLLDRQQYKQEAMPVLFAAGITEPPTLVTCGYTLDGLDLARVRIQRDCKGHDRWYYDIYGEVVAVVEPLHLDGIEEARPAAVRSARLPREADEETGTDD